MRAVRNISRHRPRRTLRHFSRCSAACCQRRWRATLFTRSSMSSNGRTRTRRPKPKLIDLEWLGQKGCPKPGAGRRAQREAQLRHQGDDPCALSAKGGQAYFENQADKNPAAFMALVGKILPTMLT